MQVLSSGSISFPSLSVSMRETNRYRSSPTSPQNEGLTANYQIEASSPASHRPNTDLASLRLGGSGDLKSKPNPNSQSKGKLVQSSPEPYLRWGEEDTGGVTSSGWNPFKGTNVCFKDESLSKQKISLIIEPPAPGAGLSLAALVCVPYWPIICQAIAARAECHGYFFEKNEETGKIDMTHRSKPFRGKEEKKLYRDCTYFGVTMHSHKYPDGITREESAFTLTSGYSDKHFPTGVNFCPETCKDLQLIVGAINDLISSVQGDIDIAATARVYPLFCTNQEYEKQCRVHEIAQAQKMDEGEREGDGMGPIYVDCAAVRITDPMRCSYKSETTMKVGREKEGNEGKVSEGRVMARVRGIERGVSWDIDEETRTVNEDDDENEGNEGFERELSGDTEEGDEGVVCAVFLPSTIFVVEATI